MGDVRDELLRHVPKLLSRWVGGRGHMYELTVDHPTLEIRLTRADTNAHLSIHCLGPEHISGPVRWVNAAVKIEKAGDSKYVISDSQVGLRVIAAAVEVKEHGSVQKARE